MLLLHEIAFEFSRLRTSQLHKSTVLLCFLKYILTLGFFTIFSCLLTLDPMGPKTSKHYSSLESLLIFFFKYLLNFLLSVLHNRTVCICGCLTFHDFFFFFAENFTFTIVSYKEPITATTGVYWKGVIVEWNRVKSGPLGVRVQCTGVQVSLRSFGAFPICDNLACIAQTSGRRVKRMKILAYGVSI